MHLSELRGVGAPGASERAVWEWLRGPDGSLPSGRAWNSSLRKRPAEKHPAEGQLARLHLPAPAASSLAEREPCQAGLGCLWIGAYGPWDFESGAAPPELGAHGGLLAELRWDAVWFPWDEASDPRADLELWRAQRFAPADRALTPGWADPWGDTDRRALVGEEQFGLIASTKLTLAEAGSYALEVSSDDGVRVLVDGVVVLEDWTWHAEQRARIALELEAGERELRVEDFQVGGPAVLTVALHRRTEL